MDILSRIITERRIAVQEAKKLTPAKQLEKLAHKRRHNSLVDRLRSRHTTAIIAELKKASPSAGVIRPEYNPSLLARELYSAGAIALSVLTEPKYFLGNNKHLQEVRATVPDIPILRKDFICESYQIVESAALGADIILLIISALDRPILENLYTKAISYGLDVLIEVHTSDEIPIALEFKQAIIGINNRNLKTFKTNLSVTKKLLNHIPDERLVIAESGISTRTEIVELEQMRCDGFLIGETIMRSSNVKKTLHTLIGI